jgi:hypothetical protein
MSSPRYLEWCLAMTFVMVGAVAGINYWADPCGIYHANESWDWIRSRPEILSVAFINKARAVEHAKADVLFMGSSRTAEGLDPHAPAVPPNAYNFGLPGSSVYEDWRYLQHACAAHVPTTLVLGVDNDSFWAARQNSPLFSDDRLLVQADGSPTSRLTNFFSDLAPTLLSFSTLELSFKTLFPPKDSHLRFDDGYEANAPLITEHLDLASRVLAANRKWVENNIPADFRGPDGKAPQMDAFGHIVDLCAEKHIRLIVYVQPVHAALLDNFTKNWPLYVAWMKELTRLMESQPTLQGEFWDFASYNSMNTEPFPRPTDTYSHMQYYWEGSHYRKVVGDMVLRRIFTGGGPPSFGELVTSQNVDADLERLRSQKIAWHDHRTVMPIAMTAVQTRTNP